MPVSDTHAAGEPILAADINALAALANTTEAAAAALSTTVAGKQPLDPDLTAFAGLDSTTAGALATDGSGWVRKTYAQLKTALGLVKADVGLGNVDNTADTAKPISTATQTALDLKAPLASPAFTGTPTKGGSALLTAADAAAAYVTVVQAGSDANTARPDVPPGCVKWVCDNAVTPVNAVPGDDIFNFDPVTPEETWPLVLFTGEVPFGWGYYIVAAVVTGTIDGFPDGWQVYPRDSVFADREAVDDASVYETAAIGEHVLLAHYTEDPEATFPLPAGTEPEA